MGENRGTNYSVITRKGRKTPIVVITLSKAVHASVPHLPIQIVKSLGTTDPSEAKRRAASIYAAFITQYFGHETDPDVDFQPKRVRVEVPPVEQHEDGSRTVLFGEGKDAELVTYDVRGRERARKPAPRWKTVPLTQEEKNEITTRNWMMEHVVEGPIFRERDFEARPVASRQKKSVEPRPLTFLDLFEKYAAFQIAKENIRDGTIREFRNAAKAFDDFVQHRPIAELRRSDVEAFVTMLMKLPSRRAVPHEIRDAPLPDLIEWRKRNRAGGISKSTIAKMLAACRAAWGYGSKHDEFGITKPIFTGIITKDEVASDRKARGHFTDSEVRALIAALPKLRSREDRLYASILMYCGCRFDEVRQMQLKRHDGVLCFDLLEADPKTVESRRLIPVHDELLRMGVAEANWIRAIKRDHREGSSDSTNKRVNRWIKAVTGDDSHSAHWLRHTVVTKLETASVPEQFVRVLVGHAAQRDAHSVYSHLLKQVRELKVAINQLDYSAQAS